jgi:uncharacterized protein YxeA
MKHTIIVTVSIITIVVLGAISVGVYNTDQARAYLATVKEQAEKQANAKVQELMVNHEKAQVKKACDQSTAYYNDLTAKQKATVPAPDCNLATIQ